MDDGTFYQWATRECERLRHLRGDEQLDGLLQLAQEHAGAGDVEGQAAVLETAMQAASDQDRLVYKLRIFGELRRIYVEDPNRAHLRRSVLWFGKWIAQSAVNHAEVPLETIERLMSEMEELYRAERMSLRPVFKIRCTNAMYMGRTEESDEWFARWEAEPRSEVDDCRACEWALRAERLREQQRDAEALDAAKDITNTRNWCGATPEIASMLIPAAVRCGRIQLAAWLEARCRRPVRREARMLHVVGVHAIHWALLGQFTRARRWAIVGYRAALPSRNDRKNVELYRLLAQWSVLAAMREKGGDATAKIPARLLRREGEDLPLNMVADVSLPLGWATARALDARNGTDRYAERMRRAESAIRNLIEHGDSGGKRARESS